MPLFNLIADQTNILNERWLTWTCTTCGFHKRIQEFPHAETTTQAHMECPQCQLVSHAAVACEYIPEDELEASALKT